MEAFFDQVFAEYGLIGAIVCAVAFLLRKELLAIATGRITDPTLEILQQMSHEIGSINESVRDQSEKFKERIDRNYQEHTRTNFLLDRLIDEVARSRK